MSVMKRVVDRTRSRLAGRVIKGRIVLFLDPSMFVPERGYRPAMVVEGEKGYHLNGDWPYHGEPGEKMPWFFGPTFEDAQRQVKEMNERMGLTEDDVARIITESMR